MPPRPLRPRDEPAASSLALNSPAAKPPPLQRSRKNASRACRHCRSKRIKCSGTDPCSNCEEKGLDCVIDTAHDGRRRTTDSRTLALELSRSEDRNADLAKELEKYRLILRRQQRASTPEFEELVSRISHAASTQDLIETVVAKINSAAHTSSLDRSAERRSDTTESDRELLDQLLRFLRRADNASFTSLLSLAQGGASEKDLLAYFATESRRKEILGKRRRHLSVGSLCEKPLYALSARPWTSVFDDDTFISHLVSLFFTWVNNFMPVVDEATFIPAMKSGLKNSPYCNDVLVNAILSIGCHNSNDPAAFADPDDMSTRGHHFLHESVRLWEASSQRSSFLNLQTVTALMLAATMANTDSKYMKYLDQMGNMRDRLERNLPARFENAQRHQLDDEDRIGVFALWNCLKIQITWSVLFPRSMLISAPKLGIELYCGEQYQSSWSCYPFDSSPRDVPTGFLEHQECKLQVVLSGLHQVMYKAANLHMVELLPLVKVYAANLHDWYSDLPDECRRVSKRFGCSVRALNLECQFHHFRLHLVLMLNKAQDAQEASTERQNFAKAIMTDSTRKIEELIMIYKESFPKHTHMAHVTTASLTGLLALIDSLDDRSQHRTFHTLLTTLLDVSERIYIFRGIIRMVLINVHLAGKRIPKATRLRLEEVGFDSWDLHNRVASEFQIIGTPTEVEAPDGLSSLLEKWSHFTLNAGEEEEEDDDDDVDDDDACEDEEGGESEEDAGWTAEARDDAQPHQSIEKA